LNLDSFHPEFSEHYIEESLAKCMSYKNHDSINEYRLQALTRFHRIRSSYLSAAE
jgi:hypothetical protein